MSATVAAAPTANTASIQSLRQHQLAPVQEPADQTVDLFSAKGFALAQRIAQAFSTSNAVPVPFRQWHEKKVQGGGVEWVENTAAMGNCLVAIETARALDMSITAVMQNANVIEGRLTWSAQYKIAAINASHRFTPLRFQIINKGVIKASYREKSGWNKEERRYNFREVTVEVENLECVAWALPRGVAEPQVSPELLRQFPNRLLDMYKALGLPVIESAPVSMKLAVEEGWYGKSGSKWQTEMKHLMLQYRAGSFFGNIHAPDVVMGMGRTTEEVQDAIVLDVDHEGRVTSVSVEDLSVQPARGAEEVVQKNTTGADEEHAPADQQAAADARQPEAQAQQQADANASVEIDIEGISDRLAAAATVEALDQLVDELVRPITNADVKETLNSVYSTRREELENPKPAAATSRRARTSQTSME